MPRKKFLLVEYPLVDQKLDRLADRREFETGSTTTRTDLICMAIMNGVPTVHPLVAYWLLRYQATFNY
jgi:hypothetical protein